MVKSVRSSTNHSLFSKFNKRPSVFSFPLLSSGLPFYIFQLFSNSIPINAHLLSVAKLLLDTVQFVLAIEYYSIVSASEFLRLLPLNVLHRCHNRPLSTVYEQNKQILRVKFKIFWLRSVFCTIVCSFEYIECFRISISKKKTMSEFNRPIFTCVSMIALKLRFQRTTITPRIKYAFDSFFFLRKIW